MEKQLRCQPNGPLPQTAQQRCKCKSKGNKCNITHFVHSYFKLDMKLHMIFLFVNGRGIPGCRSHHHFHPHHSDQCSHYCLHHCCQYYCLTFQYFLILSIFEFACSFHFHYHQTERDYKLIIEQKRDTKFGRKSRV